MTPLQLTAAALILLAAAAKPPQFTDVTAASGIPQLKHGEGVCMSDLDSDGLPELYLPDVKGPDRLFRNMGGLKFTDITKGSGITVSGGIGAVVADLDLDGSKDIYVVRGAYPYGLNVLYMGRRDGVFTDASVAAGVQSRKNGISATVADLDMDGLPDIFVSNWGADTLYRNTSGTGRPAFDDISEKAGAGADGRSWAAVSADFNSDGLPDLFVARGGPGCTDTCRLYINRGGRFSDETAASGLSGVSAMGALTLDVDGDGDQDIFVTSFDGPDRLFVNDGKARFKDATNGSGINSSRSVGAAAGDINGDLLPDIVVAGFAGPVRLFMNAGGGRFRDMTAGSGIGPQKKNEGIALGDLDGDGDLDLYVASYDGHNALYRNNLDTPDFIKVRPTIKGRAAIGAEVRLYRRDGADDPGALLASYVCQAGYGFCSQSPEEALFRLPDKGPYDVEVRFPDRAVARVENVKPGVINVAEPEPKPATTVSKHTGQASGGKGLERGSVSR